MSDADVTVRCLTPPGSAAIAALELRGSGAWDVVRELFRPRSGELLPDAPSAGLLVPGSIGPPPGDEVVLAVRAAAPEAVIEVHCHGGNEVVRWLIDTFHAAGTSVAGLSEAGKRVPTGHAELASLRPATEAFQLLVHAPSLRTASILLDQYHGAFDRALDDIDSAISENRVADATRCVEQLLQFVPLGAHLVHPWRVVLAGAPNVGKSSLLNALAGYQRCVVTPIPGTTRDVVTARLVFDGWPVELADTAGQRPTADPLEATGVARAAAARHDADLCVWVVETGAEPVWPTRDEPHVLRVVNKIDQPFAWTASWSGDLVSVSAQTGYGLDQLIRAIVDRLVPAPPPANTAIPITPEQVAGLQAISARLTEGRSEQARSEVARARGTSDK